jgi:hypothetical protein
VRKGTGEIIVPIGVMLTTIIVTSTMVISSGLSKPALQNTICSLPSCACAMNPTGMSARATKNGSSHQTQSCTRREVIE